MVLQISRKSIKACASYSNFKRCCEKKKNMRQTSRAHISGKAWQILSVFLGYGSLSPDHIYI